MLVLEHSTDKTGVSGSNPEWPILKLKSAGVPKYIVLEHSPLSRHQTWGVSGTEHSPLQIPCKCSISSDDSIYFFVT